MALVKKKQQRFAQKKSNLKLWIPFVAIGIALMGLCYHGADNIYRAFKSRQWPSAQGEVIHSKLEREYGSYRSSAPSRRARIIYRYQVDDRAYRSDQVFWGAESFYYAAREPKELLRRYPVGKAVSVFYNPGNPKEAVLERKTRIFYYGLFGFCTVILFFQAYFLVYLWP
jgi:hypothetical protein